MISDNEPILSRYISVPKELSQLNCNAFVAGIVEAVLDGCQFVSIFCIDMKRKQRKGKEENIKFTFANYI